MQSWIDRELLCRKQKMLKYKLKCTSNCSHETARSHYLNNNNTQKPTKFISLYFFLTENYTKIFLNWKIESIGIFIYDITTCMSLTKTRGIKGRKVNFRKFFFYLAVKFENFWKLADHINSLRFPRHWLVFVHVLPFATNYFIFCIFVYWSASSDYLFLYFYTFIRFITLISSL